MILIAGLGNKGREYNWTKHNIGFEFINFLISEFKIKNLKKNKVSEYTQYRIKNQPILLIKPLTFMNLSGKAIRFFFDRYKINVNNIIIIHDDIDLPMFKIKIKKGGESAGHKGIESIINELKDDSFIRIRVGIGRPEKKEEVVDYVLSKFSEKEKNEFVNKFKLIKNFIYDFINFNYEKAISRFKG